MQDTLFSTKKLVGKHTYRVTIEKKEDRLELNALFPYVLDQIDLHFWQEKLKKLNRAATCGDYIINENGDGIVYRVYSLYSSPNEVKDAVAIQSLLEKCIYALETQAEPMLAPGKIRSGIEWARQHIMAVKKKSDDTSINA